MNEVKADLVLTDGRVYTGEVLDGLEMAVSEGRIR